jgi:Uma2 family endonuclease
MTTVLNPPEVRIEERFVLHDVSWETYEQLLKNYESRSVPRFTYDQGNLEIMSPSIPHEEAREALILLVNMICEVRELDVRGLGSTTHKRADLLKGVEPDACFYIQNVESITGKHELDLTVSPPADLVIEIDISSPSIAKLPIYSALGVPEVWWFANAEIKFLRLGKEQYAVVNESIVLPRVLAQDVTRFVNEAGTVKRPQWLRSAREWTRSLENF